MNTNYCQIESHQAKKIISICFNTECKGKRVCCFMCQNQLHNDHLDQLIDVEDVLKYLKSESQKPSDIPHQVGQRLQTLKDFLDFMVDFSKLIQIEIQNLASMNAQFFCKDLGNQYNIISQDVQGLGNQQWNQLTETMLSSCYVQNSSIQFKVSEQSITKCVTNILNKSIEFQQQIDLIQTKEYFQSLNEPQLVEGHSDIVCGIDICNQRNLLASGSQDKTVRLWDLNNNTLITVYKSLGAVYDVVFSNSGNLLAFNGVIQNFWRNMEYTVKLIDITDLTKENIVTELYGHKEIIYRMQFSNDSKFLISGSCDKQVIVWDVNTKKERFRSNSESPVHGVAIRSDDTLVASNSSDGKIRIWSFQTQQLLCSKHAHKYGVGIEFSNDLKMLVSSCWNGIIKLWSLEKINQSKLALILEIKAANNYIWTVLFSPCSKFIISICNRDKEIKVLRSLTGEVVKQFKSKSINNQDIVQVAISQDMKILAYGEDKNIIVLRNK